MASRRRSFLARLRMARCLSARAAARRSSAASAAAAACEGLDGDSGAACLPGDAGDS